MAFLELEVFRRFAISDFIIAVDFLCVRLFCVLFFHLLSPVAFFLVDGGVNKNLMLVSIISQG